MLYPSTWSDNEDGIGEFASLQCMKTLEYHANFIINRMRARKATNDQDPRMRCGIIPSFQKIGIVGNENHIMGAGVAKNSGIILIPQVGEIINTHSLIT